MEQRMTATEARTRFGEVLRRVGQDGETIVIERRGAPKIVFVSIEEYARLNLDPTEAITQPEARDR